MKNEPHFRIIEHQAFIAVVPMYTQNADGTRTPILAGALTDLSVQVTVKNGDTVSASAYTVTTNATNGILIDFAVGLDAGVYSVLITAKYAGRPIQSRYNEAFEAVVWNGQTTYDNFVTGSEIVLPEYVFVMSADTAGIEQLREQLQSAIAAAEAEKAAYERKLHDLEDVAKQGNNPDATNTAILAKFDDISIDTTTLAKEQTLTNGIQSILTALNPKATTSDVTAAKQAILDALSQIQPEDPNSKALAEFFGVTLLQGYEFMQDTEVTDELEDIMQTLDPELLQEVEYPEGSGTYITKAQAITAEAMQIINPSQS